MKPEHLGSAKICLDAATLPEGHRLRTVLAKAFHKRPTPLPDVENARSPAGSGYWSPDFFGLSKCKFFLNASPAEQLEIQTLCSDRLMEEAYYIEKGGMFY